VRSVEARIAVLRECEVHQRAENGEREHPVQPEDGIAGEADKPASDERQDRAEHTHGQPPPPALPARFGAGRTRRAGQRSRALAVDRSRCGSRAATAATVDATPLEHAIPLEQQWPSSSHAGARKTRSGSVRLDLRAESLDRRLDE
jgi:hypothetical protein